MKNTIAHMIKYRDVGKELMKLRKNAGLSRVQVSERTGIHKVDVYRHEKGFAIPTESCLKAYSKLYGVNL